MSSEEFHGESSAFLRLLDLEQMSRAFDEAVVIAALDPECLVRGTRPGSGLHIRIAADQLDWAAELGRA